MIQRALIAATASNETVGLMLSGGIDSAILLVELLQDGCQVQPFYVSTGCRWDGEERQSIDRFLGEINNASVQPVVDLAMPVAELYAHHWSMTGQGVPDESTADDAVYLPARNPLLLLKPLLWCGEHGITRLALGTLSANPFADATPQFFQQFAAAIATATEKPVEIVRPFADKTKAELLGQATDVPLQLTFSCLSPHNGRHCGACNKCAERSRALRLSPAGDPTDYVHPVDVRLADVRSVGVRSEGVHTESVHPATARSESASRGFESS